MKYKPFSMKLILIAVSLLFSSVFTAQTIASSTSSESSINKTSNKKIWHRARIFYNSNEQLALLASQGVPLDHGKKKIGVFIESDFSENEIAIARMIGCEVEILIENVSQFYIDQNKVENQKPKSFEKNANCSGVSIPSYTTPANWELGSMGGFYTYNEMLAELDQMATLYPNLITVKAPISTFQTEEGRSIFWVKISDNPNVDEGEPQILYNAIHHAREPASMQQMIYYMWYMLENYATNDEVKAIVDNTEMFFIPVLNPDGYQFNCTQNPNGGGMFRKNRRNHGNGDFGVDNNRNYNYTDAGGNDVWGTTGVSFNTGNDTYPGSGPFSEVENQAMKWFCENHDFKLALNNHSWDNSLLFPFGYANNEFTPDHNYYLEISSEMTVNNGLGMVPKLSSLLYPASGDSDDWQYGADLATKAKIFSFTPEIGNNGFWPAAAQIETICNSMVYTNLTAALLITNYAKINDASPFYISQLNDYFKYDIQRLGMQEPANFTVSINPISANILSVGNANTHTNMTMSQSDLDSISFALSPSIQAGDEVSYELIIDNGMYERTVLATKIYGEQTNLFTDVGNNINNWDVSQTWNTTTADYVSPSSSITDSPNGNYGNNINKRITLTDEIELTNAVAATVEFYAKWEIEAGYDYVQFEVSTDGGSSWIPQCGKYTKLGSQNQDGGKPLYDGFQTQWVKEIINLSDYLGNNVKFRFKIVSDNWVNEDGFYFDDFKVNIILPDNIGVENIDVILNGYPNPTNDVFNISYAIQNVDENTVLRLSNNLGQTIRNYPLSQNNGTLQISTQDLTEGVYFYSIINAKGNAPVKKFMVVR